MEKRCSFVAIFLLAAALAGCAANNNNTDIPIGEEINVARTTFSFDQDKAPYSLFDEYPIAPGDVLDVLFQIRTWVEKEDFVLAVDHTLDIRFVHAPQLNQQQRIRPDGTISLPYIGVKRVVGKTIDALAAELEDAYNDILRNPAVYIIVPEFRSSIKELKHDLHTAPRGLSRLVTVRPDGHVTFPMIGGMSVAGRTIPEVNKELNDLYEDILPGLHCDLFLEKHSGTFVYVLGQVNEPGTYNIVKPITVAQAITMAGSYSQEALLDSIMVIRRSEDKMVATRIDLEDNLDFTTESSVFFLLPDDIVFIPRKKIHQAAEIARRIGDIIFFRGWSVGFSWELHDAATDD